MKNCPKCNKLLSFDNFYKSNKTKSGYRCWCKICTKIDNASNELNYKSQRKAYRERNSEEIKEKKKIYYQNNKERIDTSNKKYNQTEVGKYKSYIASANFRKLDFNLSFEEFTYLINLKLCRYCGIIGDVGIDRLDSSIGYNISNCIPCCNMCNKFKVDHTLEEFLNKIRQIYKQNQEYYKYN